MSSTMLASHITVRRGSATALYLRILLAAKERLREGQSKPDQKPVQSSLGISCQHDPDVSKPELQEGRRPRAGWGKQ